MPTVPRHLAAKYVCKYPHSLCFSFLKNRETRNTPIQCLFSLCAFLYLCLSVGVHNSKHQTHTRNAQLEKEHMKREATIEMDPIMNNENVARKINKIKIKFNLKVNFTEYILYISV